MSEAARGKYHHGDLRAALIAEGLRQLDGEDAAEPSLRELARAAGVSATAVYRHFPDKGALRTALAHTAYERLGAAQAEAAAGARGDLGREFEAVGRAYVRFALDHPAMFRLMTSVPLAHDIFDMKQEEDEASKLLHSYARKLAGEGASTEAVRHVAMRAWALVHGLAVLMLDGYAPRDPALIDAVVDTRAFDAAARRS